MKTLIMILTLLLAVSAWAKDVLPENNFCSPLVDSKRYLNTDFGGKYPRQVKFECTYRCKVNGRIDSIVAISSMVINSMEEDAKNVVCQGVLIKKVPWGFDFDKVQPFYAYKSTLKEIKRWAFANVNLDINSNATEATHLLQLKKDLYAIAGPFIVAGSNGAVQTAHFKVAAESLSAIADDLPENTTLLDQAIDQIVAHKGKFQSLPAADSLVLLMLSSSAAWRIPSHLY